MTNRKRRSPLWAGTASVAAACVSATGAARASDVAMLYMLNCQGCHQADGSGQQGYIPDFRNSIARFLAIPEGRAYLGRVPGTSQSLLGDDERADVLNWVVRTFDPQHIPVGFEPYTAAEMAVYRQDPLTMAFSERTRVLQLLADAAPGLDSGATHQAAGAQTPTLTSSTTAAPPPQFALCAACHPSSADGVSAMGPNLRGVMGRRAGSLPGFAHSAALKSSGLVWSSKTMDAFLKNVQGTVPGTLMGLSSVPDANDRAQIINYLETLN